MITTWVPKSSGAGARRSAPEPAACATLKAMRLNAEPGRAGARLDLFLSKQIQGASRALIQEWIRDGHVRVDGQVERKGSHKLRGGETVEVEPTERKPLQAEPEAMISTSSTKTPTWPSWTSRPV